MVVPEVVVFEYVPLQSTEAVPDGSVELTVNVTDCKGDFAVVDTFIFSGQVKMGGVVSYTVTGKVQLALLPALSFALHKTYVVPKLNVAPVDLLQGVPLKTTPLPESDAEKEYVTGALGLAPVVGTLILVGQFNTGGR